jgi:hypothetical protein
MAASGCRRGDRQIEGPGIDFNWSAADIAFRKEVQDFLAIELTPEMSDGSCAKCKCCP